MGTFFFCFLCGPTTNCNRTYSWSACPRAWDRVAHFAHGGSLGSRHTPVRQALPHPHSTDEEAEEEGNTGSHTSI